MHKIRPLWLLVAIAILAVVSFFLTRAQVDRVHQGSSGEAPQLQNSVYIPSPYELNFINATKDIWPRRFSQKNPPLVSDIPALYKIFENVRPSEKSEIQFFKAVAVTANLGEWGAFADILKAKLKLAGGVLTPGSLLKWAKAEACSPYGLDLSYRLVMWDASTLTEVSRYFSQCQPNSFHAFYFKVLSKQSDATSMQALRNEAQARREHLPNGAFEYFLLTQVFTALDLKLAHQ